MKIGTFADQTGISAYTLRYYEKKGLLKVCRDTHGCRVYAKDDVEWVKFLQKLKATGMLLRDIRKYADLRYEGEVTIGARLELLIVHQDFVDEEIKKWQQYSENLQNKIAVYRQLLEQQSHRPDT
ncbi:MerR family transcriptional regulator [Phascolarctobacterium sp.]|uniref:MerR family transcriptional regulator n=1 Tax=Phascolarctobacterium sp. TaxID=2049039 RepID=UPI0015AD2D1F|nr:MerR family transcriptional regulator [uncultured Phascolarctobacterium sp.]